MPHILYFIGAGLTKALEKDKQVPLMNDFVSVAADHLLEDGNSGVILTTLCSLITSHSFRWEFPHDATTLAEKLANADPDGRTPQEIRRMQSFLKRHPAENIEDLLTKVHHMPNESLANTITRKSLPIRFSFAINRIFAKVGWDLDLQTLKEFIDRCLVGIGNRHTFVSFNYDLILDRALSESGKWAVQGGYGFPLFSWVGPTEALEHMRRFPDPPENSTGGSFSPLNAKSLPKNDVPTDYVLLLKPHGSLNWLVPYDGNYVFQDKEPAVVLDESKPAYYSRFDLEHLRPNLNQMPNTRAIFLLPPGAKESRFSFIQETLQREKSALREADQVFVAGWSMPKTDKEQECLIRHTVKKRSAPFKCVTAVNQGESPEYFERVADVFGVKKNKLKIYNNGFKDFVQDDCQ